MKRMLISSILAGIALSAASLGAIDRVDAETFVGSSVESRVMLGFKVDDSAAKALLPEGWEPVTLPKGPVAGANFFLVFMDRHLIRDAQGNPAAPAANRAAALLSYAKKADTPGVRAFITHVFETAPLSDPYGNSVAADITRKAASEGGGSEPARRSEEWVIRPQGDGTIAFTMRYQAGRLAWTEDTERTPYSAATPDFYRIYRYDQLAELAMNTTIGKGLAGEASFKSDYGDLAAVFDGIEALVAIVSIPVYVREVFLP